MSSATPDSVRAEITENAIVAGNPVKTSALAKATASKPLYVDSSSNLASGSFPFAIPVTGAASTSMSLLSLTGYSSLSGVNDLGLTLVAGGTASATIVGFVRVSITDSAGNITDGSYYMPYMTLA